MKNALVLSYFVLLALINNCAFGQHTWTATIKVVGDDGSPVIGADVTAFYKLPPPANQNIETGPNMGQVKGLTDANGEFIASHTDSSFDLGITVTKAGYYTTHIGHQFYFSGQFDAETVAANWNPTLTLMLRKIEKPIPMYAKSITYIKFPVFNKPVGYDLMAGDWIAPYGKGVNTDFLFSENHADAKAGYTFAVSFPNLADGIQEFSKNRDVGTSGLLSPHKAPENGYQPKYEQTQMPDPNRIYFFRVRTVLDENGNVKSALYGKIYGDFMQFRYYLDPTPNDRNIEFDPNHNLLGGLESFEGVDAP